MAKPSSDARELDRLQEELAAAGAEILQLRAENQLLRSDRPQAVVTPHLVERMPTLFPDQGLRPSGSVRLTSAVEAKISLYRSPFAGRTDVFAQRWESKATPRVSARLEATLEVDRTGCHRRCSRL